MSRQKQLRVDAAKTTAALTHTLDVVGSKWTIPIIASLLGGTRRFGELQTGLGGVSPKMLIARLRELEQEGYLTRTLYPEIPPRVEYALTDEGRSLKPIIAAMEEWGARHRRESKTAAD